MIAQQTTKAVKSRKGWRFTLKPKAGAIAWPKLLVGSLMVALVGGLLLFNLQNLLPASPIESQTISNSRTLSAITDNPLLLPYKLLAFVLIKLPLGSDLLAVRLASVIISCMSVWLFFITARRWYGTNSSLWASVLFASSGWLLQTGRFGAGFSLLILMVLSFVCFVSWLTTIPKRGSALVLFAVLLAVALFVPGGLWFALLTTSLAYRPLLAHRSAATASQLAGAGVIVLAAFAILAYCLLSDSSLLSQWLGLPGQFPGIMTIAKQAVFSLLYLVVKGPMMPELWLAHTPLLDIASSVFLLLGVIFYAKHLGNSRTRLLAGFAILGAVLIALNGPAGISYLVPTAYLVAAGGSAYFLHQWNKIFPRNPIAKIVSLSLMAVLLACIVSFHGHRYFVAWRHSPDTVQVYGSGELDTDRAHLVQ